MRREEKRFSQGGEALLRKGGRALMRKLNDVYFGVDVDAELLHDVLADLLAEGDYLCAGGSTEIDEDKSLLVVDGCTTERLAFPAALLYHPAGRNLLLVVADMVVGHRWVLGKELLELFAADNRIHEEAAAIAENLRVRELGIANGNDGVTDILGRRFSDAALLKGFAYAAVFYMRSEDGGELVGDGGDEILVLPLILETALAVSVVAVGIHDGDLLASGEFHGIDAMDDVLGFHAVSADVLHGRGADIAGDDGEILHAIVAKGYSGGYDIIEAAAGTGSEEQVFRIIWMFRVIWIIRVVRCYGDSFDGGVEDDAVVVLG